MHDAMPRAFAQRASWWWTLFTWVLAVSCLVVAVFPTVIAGVLGPLVGDRRRRVAHLILAGAYRLMVRVHPRYQLTMSGVEHLGAGPAILCPNHQSLADVVYLFSLPGQIRWMVKRELFHVPLFGLGLWAAGYLAVDRGDAKSALLLLARAQRGLEDGVSVLTFPEGTRSRTGELGPFNSGAARLALASGVPLIPVGVAGTDWLLPKGSACYAARGHVANHIGTPIRVGRDEVNARVLTRRLQQAVREARDVARARVAAASNPRYTPRASSLDSSPGKDASGLHKEKSS